MAADEDGDGIYSLEEEIELLSAIYIHELTVEREKERPTAVSVLLHPSTGDEEDKRFVCLTLLIHLPKKYLCELPSIHIKTPRGLSEAHVDSILANLRELAEGCLGRPMLYELIEYAKDSLTDNNMPSCACAICLCHFQDTHEFTKTECYHYFHSGCLARYIKFSLQLEKETEDDTKVECPMCRMEIAFNLDELEAFASDDVDEEKFVYKPSEEIKKLQKEMTSLYEKQKRKGGVIDLDKERNRYLIDITSVRQEEAVHENEPCAGPETADKVNTSSAEFTQTNSPERGGVARETSQLDNVICKDRSEDKKEFLKHSGPTRTRQRSDQKTRNRLGEGKSDYYDRKRNEKKCQSTNNRPNTAGQRLNKKEYVKPSENLEGDFALWSENKSESSQTRLETEINPPVDNLESAVTDVSNKSKNIGSQNFRGEKSRSVRRGKGKVNRGRSSTASTHGTTEGGRVADTDRTSCGEEVGKISEDAAPSESSKAIPEKKSLHKPVKENPSDKRKRTNNKDKVCKPPPGFENLKTDEGECVRSTNISEPPPGFEHLSAAPLPWGLDTQ